jgi:meiotically up-regulated gene 157 (Mug157) protein
MKSPYGSSFRLQLRPEDDLKDFHVTKARNLYVAMHNYELDSLCYHIWLSYHWWKVSGRSDIFDAEWQRVAHIIITLWIVEQYHDTLSPYRYKELTRDNGKWSSEVSYTGMTWSAFRPSDDQTQYGYLVPSNMFAVVALNFLEEIARYLSSFIFTLTI